MLLFGFVLILAALLFSSLFATNQAKATSSHLIYLPLISNNAVFSYQFTLSRYMGYNSNQLHDLTEIKMNNLGCSLGNSISVGSDVLMILDYGQPWRNISGVYVVKLYDQPFYTFVSTSMVRYWSKSYLDGFGACSPSNSHLSLSIGTTNQGAYVGQTHGEQWGTMVNEVASYAESKTYSSKVRVYGGIDNELLWNGRQASLNWASGYGNEGFWEYLYFGNCSGCPTDTYFWYDPDGDWTLEDVYLMADGKYLAETLPQIYATSGINAEQWYYVSIYSFEEHEYPLTILGSLTQWDACQDRPTDCHSGQPDSD